MSKRDKFIRKIRNANDGNYAHQIWWKSLSDNEKYLARDKYEKQRIENNKRKIPYPMPETAHLRLSKIPDKTIERIYVFKDCDINLIKTR